MKSLLKNKLARIFVAAAAIAGIFQDLFIGLSNGVPYVWVLFGSAAVCAFGIRMIPALSQRMQSIFSEAWFAPIFVFLIVTTVGTMFTGYYSRGAWISSGGNNDGSGFLVSQTEEILAELGHIKKKGDETNKHVKEIKDVVVGINATEIDISRYMSLLANLDDHNDYESILESFWERGRVGPNTKYFSGSVIFDQLSFRSGRFSQEPMWLRAVESDSVTLSAFKKYLGFYFDRGYLSVDELKTVVISSGYSDSERKISGGCKKELASGEIDEHCLAYGYIRWYKNVEKVGGITPLIHSIAAGANEKFDALIEMGVDVEQSDAAGYHPIDYALVMGNKYAAEKLVELGVDIGQRSATVCAFADLARIASKYGEYGIKYNSELCLKYAPYLKGEQKERFLNAVEVIKKPVVDELNEIVKDNWDGYSFHPENKRKSEILKFNGVQLQEKIKKLESLDYL